MALLYLPLKNAEFIIMCLKQSFNTDILSMTIIQVIVTHLVNWKYRYFLRQLIIIQCYYILIVDMFAFVFILT